MNPVPDMHKDVGISLKNRRNFMNPYLTVIGGACLFLLAAAWLITAENRRQKKERLKQIREQFGSVCERSCTGEELERISAFSRREDSKIPGYLDDITWNDLEMDTIFSKINRTMSAPGEEYLYRVLRLPKLMETSGHFRQMIHFFQQNDKAREEMQLILADIGKKTRYNTEAAVRDLEHAARISYLPHLLQAGALAVSLLLLAVFPVAAVFATFALLVLNAFTYQMGRDRKASEPCIHLFASLGRILEAGGRLEKVAWPQVENNCKAVARIRRDLGRFRRRLFWFSGGQGAGGSLGGLLLDYLKLFFHIDLIVYPGLLAEAKKHQSEFQELLEAVGEMDAAICVASFRKWLPWYCEPEFDSSPSGKIELEEVYHPLLKNPVPNTMETSGHILLTGSNASGKSTFLKAVAVNGILAQTIDTCTAARYRAPRFQICSSIALRDSIQDGESYFMAEIRSLKRIMDFAQGGAPLLCVIDEVLRGTNTIERIAASSGILRSLARPSVYCLAATHDLELTAVLKNYYENYHFEETVEGEDVCFGYKLRKGPSTSRNALVLLEKAGYGKETVEAARVEAEQFQKSGIWEILK